MNLVMLSVNRTAPVLIMLSENRPVFFGAYPSRIPAQAPREDGTVSQEQAGNAVSLCCQTVTDGTGHGALPGQGGSGENRGTARMRQAETRPSKLANFLCPLF